MPWILHGSCSKTWLLRGFLVYNEGGLLFQHLQVFAMSFTNYLAILIRHFWRKAPLQRDKQQLWQVKPVWDDHIHKCECDLTRASFPGWEICRLLEERFSSFVENYLWELQAYFWTCTHSRRFQLMATGLHPTKRSCSWSFQREGICSAIWHCCDGQPVEDFDLEAGILHVCMAFPHLQVK